MTAPDFASALGGAESERPRRTRTGRDGVDPSQVLDIGAVPEIAAGYNRSSFPPIADYAFLSDCETTCLISSAGSVEWLCVPRPDSPSVFGALLDRSAGRFRLGPAGVSVPAARRYLPGSLILETTWQTQTGWLIVRDALVMGPWHDVGSRSPTHHRTPMDWDAEHTLLRTVRCVSGTVELVVNCAPSFNYHRVGARWQYCGPAYGEAIASAQDDPDTHPKLRLTTNLRLGIEGREAHARTRMKEGDNVFVALSWSEPPPPQSYEQAAEKMWKTGDMWRDWINKGNFPDHPWRTYLQRSALTLKGLTYAPRARCWRRAPRHYRKHHTANGIGTTATRGCAIRRSRCGVCTRWAWTGRRTTSSRSSPRCPARTAMNTVPCK